jgi:hypothetical protein
VARIPNAARVSARIERLLGAFAVEQPRFALLFERFLAWRDYDRELASSLRDLAVDRNAAWAVRCAAVLMLEHVLLRGDDFDYWRDALGITDLDSHALRQRLARNARVHDRIATRSEAAIGDFLHLAMRECRLTLARWLWTPEEVFARIEAAVRRSRGVRAVPQYTHPFVAPESQEALRSVSALDRELLVRLGAGSVIRWTAPETSSEINSLVEHPLGTVVLTVKPPGSDTEIEIKRAGIRGRFPLDVRYDRNGEVLPPSHHLQGGSDQLHLALEASGAAIFSRLYRMVHGRTAPLCVTVHLASIFSLPASGGDVDLLDYFTDPEVFGAQYGRMRRHMERAAAELAQLTKQPRTEKLNELSLTIEFLGLTKPAQAVQVGTTSFRLERLGVYLGRDGDKRYFEQLGVPRTRAASRRFADELLDEVLGVYTPPHVPFRGYASYLDAAFAVRANRRRADGNYVNVLAQIGRFWGTLLAARGHSHGESFVARNCGLRSVFEDGEWRVRMIFMDHDSLAFAAAYETSYTAGPSVGAAIRDARFILGGDIGGPPRVHSEIDYLGDIYRVSRRIEREGTQAFRRAMKDAYDRTQNAMIDDPEVGKMFEPEFVQRLRDWDDMVRCSLAGNGWREEVTTALQQRGYGEGTVKHYLGALTTHKPFLKRMSFLFEPVGTMNAELRRSKDEG